MASSGTLETLGAHRTPIQEIATLLPVTGAGLPSLGAAVDVKWAMSLGPEATLMGLAQERADAAAALRRRLATVAECHSVEVCAVSGRGPPAIDITGSRVRHYIVPS